MEISRLQAVARSVRRSIIRMLTDAGSGHPGGSLSAVELMVALYFGHLKFDPARPDDPGRDYFILSKGHVCPVLYAVLSELQCIGAGELCTLRHMGSRLQGHPARDRDLPGIEVSTGSLGYGLSIGAGAALGLSRAGRSNRVFVLMGDGEQQEGSIWEAAMAASHFRLDNLCGIVDCNGLQIDGSVRDVMNIEPLADKYRAFGWHVITLADGHDIAAVVQAYGEASATRERPSVILARTVKGKGVSFMEGIADWHGKAPSLELMEKALAEIGD